MSGRIAILSVAFLAALGFLAADTKPIGAQDAPGADRQVSHTVTIQLQDGWNLVSIPVVPADPRPAAVFAPLGTDLRSAWAYQDGDWLLYITAGPSSFNSLAAVDQAMGLWLEMSAPSALTISGDLAETTTMPIVPGWNLVGYANTEPRPISAALSWLAGGYTAVLTYEGGRWLSHFGGVPASSGDLVWLEPARGYWIEASAAAAISVRPCAARPGEALQPFVIPSDMPAGFLQYAPDLYRVFESDIEGIAVEVAIHEDMASSAEISGFPAVAAADFAEMVFAVFRQHRCVFGGYNFDRYRVVVRGPGDDPIGYFITSEIGVDVALAPHVAGSSQPIEPPHPYTTPFAKDWVAHEMFHAWNGQLIAPIPAQPGLIFQAETWLTEGATVYYTARSRPNDPDFYHEMMAGVWETYQDAQPSDRNLTFAQLAALVPAPVAGQPPPSSSYSGLLYHKGALVSYLLDLELRAHGRTLDDLMRYLYRDYGQNGRPYTNADIAAAAGTLAGADLTSFFGSYVAGSEPLPLNGDFQPLPY